MAERSKKSKSSTVAFPPEKKLKPAVVKQEPVEPENGHVIMLPEVHIKDELPDWQVDELLRKEQATSNHNITDSEGFIKYADLKKDLKQFIETIVEETVDRCFQKHFAQLVALIISSNSTTVESDEDINPNDIHPENDLEAENPGLEQEYQQVLRTITSSPPPLVPLRAPHELRVEANVGEDDILANHVKITNALEVKAWDEKLNDVEYFNKYVRYFERQIVPNSFVEVGDNAGFLIVNQLFVPEFWQSGIEWSSSYAKDDKNAFCKFHNVLGLLYKLISDADRTYSTDKMEWFIRRRLLARKG